MVGHDAAPVLLAMDAGVRETGWAIFQSRCLVTTGIIRVPHRRRLDAEIRICYLIGCLDEVVAEWQPGAVVYSRPSGPHWPIQALELLEAGLVAWSKRQRLGLYSYSAQEVRSAMAGHPNVSRDEIAYADMAMLALIGQGKTQHESEAVAAGDYHLDRGVSTSLP